jgi:hypothetical protein
MAKAVTSPNADPWPAEGPPLDAALKRRDPAGWEAYQAVWDSAHHLERHQMIVLGGPESARSADEGRRVAALRQARATLVARIRTDVEQGEFELWGRVGSAIAEPQLIPASAIGTLQFDFEGGTARGEGVPPLYDLRLRKLGALAASDSVQWLMAEARRMKAAGEIREGSPAEKAELARLLEKKLEKAVKDGQARKALKWHYIANQLGPWGLWPISSIK